MKTKSILRKEQILREIQNFEHDQRGLTFIEDQVVLYDSVDKIEYYDHWLCPAHIWVWNLRPNHWKKNIFDRIKNKKRKVLSIFELKVLLGKMFPERYQKINDDGIKDLLSVSCLAREIQTRRLNVVKNGEYYRYSKDDLWMEKEPPRQLTVFSEVIVLNKDLLRRAWQEAESKIWHRGKNPPPF